MKINNQGDLVSAGKSQRQLITPELQPGILTPGSRLTLWWIEGRNGFPQCLGYARYVQASAAEPRRRKTNTVAVSGGGWASLPSDVTSGDCWTANHMARYLCHELRTAQVLEAKMPLSHSPLEVVSWFRPSLTSQVAVALTSDALGCVVESR